MKLYEVIVLSEGHWMWQFPSDGFKEFQSVGSLITAQWWCFNHHSSLKHLFTKGCYHMEITNWLSSSFKPGMWHKDNYFLLIDDLHMQKGKCAMNEHEFQFQPTSQFSGTVSLGWSSQKPKTSSRAPTSPTAGFARHAHGASFRRENSAALTNCFTNGRAGWNFPNETISTSGRTPY